MRRLFVSGSAALVVAAAAQGAEWLPFPAFPGGSVELDRASLKAEPEGMRSAAVRIMWAPAITTGGALVDQSDSVQLFDCAGRRYRFTSAAFYLKGARVLETYQPPDQWLSAPAENAVANFVCRQPIESK